MSSDGWVKIYRKLQDKGYYTKPEYTLLWLHFLFKASHQETEFLFNDKIIHLQPGQFITGRKKLSEETGIEESKVERICKVFKNEQQIEQQTFTKYRIITICNWTEYQGSEQQNEQPVNNKRTTDEQQMNTYKNVKKEKNDKNVKNKDMVLPDDIDAELWLAFVEMRRALKKPLTLKAQELILEKLARIGQNKNDVLKQSIENSWQGVFEIKQGGYPYGNNSGNGKSTKEFVGKASAARNFGDGEAYPVDLEVSD
jgi:flagellar motor switch/type III secretory pathway protein FliN